MSEVTRILSAIDQGDPKDAEHLLPLVYEELRKLAAQKLAHEKPGQTLQPTALVHEAYLRLVGRADPPREADEAPGGGNDPDRDRPRPPTFDSRGHFFAAAAEAMRRILVDHARRQRRPKHGGDRKRIDLDETCSQAPGPSDDLLALDEALTQLALEEPAKAELVKLRYFAGFSLDEAADLLGVSRAAAKRHWTYARAWLYSALNDADRP